MKGESRKLANSIVLQEQERQRKSGICDQDYLALLYKQQSRLSIVMAQEIAMDDEEYINIAEQWRIMPFLPHGNCSPNTKQ